MLHSNKKTKKIPTAAYRVPLMKNAFMNEIATRRALANFILGSNRLSMGEQCLKFEKAFAKKQGRKTAILFNSGGSANLAILQALKNLNRLESGDKIGFSALTWSTNVMPIIQLGFNAIPIDTDPRTLNSMSKDAILTLKENMCKAFFVTNVLGFAGDLPVLKKECDKHKIIVIEDNCESLGTKLYEGRTGNFSLASSFSFFIAHHMSTIEGGMVCTDDFEFAEMLHIVRANGWDRNLSPQRQTHWRNKHRITSDFEAKYTFYNLGYNLRPTEITGLLGSFQLSSLEKSLKIRENNFRRIHKIIADNDDFISLEWSHIKSLPAFALPFVCKTKELKQKYVGIFHDAGIEIRPMIAGNMQRQPFYKIHVKKIFSLPGADFLHENSFYCGNCPDYTEKEIQIIIQCLKK